MYVVVLFILSGSMTKYGDSDSSRSWNMKDDLSIVKIKREGVIQKGIDPRTLKVDTQVDRLIHKICCPNKKCTTKRTDWGLTTSVEINTTLS